MTIDPRSPSDETAEPRFRPAEAQREELERRVLSAIIEHRQLFESDQAVYEEWERASEAPQTAPAIIQSLQEEYRRRRAKTAAQQERLANLIDALGYVPDVPVD